MRISGLPDRSAGGAVTVESLADAVGIAADNEQLFQEARRARQWLEAASDVTTELLGGGDTGRALTLIADRTRLRMEVPFKGRDETAGRHPCLWSSSQIFFRS